MLALVAAACGSASTARSTALTVLSDCAASDAIRVRPVFVIAVSARGRVCWETVLTHPAVGAHTLSTPLAADGQAFLGSDGRLLALSAADGHVRWTWRSGAADPEMLAAADGSVVVVHGTFARLSVAGIDKQSGGVGWQDAFSAGGQNPSATDDGGVLFTSDSGEPSELIDDVNGQLRSTHVPSYEPPSVPLQQVDAQPSAITRGVIVSPLTDQGVYASSLLDGSQRWHSAGPFETATAVGGLVILTPGSTSGPPGAEPNAVHEVRAIAVDPADGHPLWQYGPFEPCGGSFSEIGGALIYRSIAGKAALARVNPDTGHDIWQVDTHPDAEVAVGGYLVDLQSAGYQQGPYTLVSRDISTGAERWQTHPTVRSDGLNDAVFAIVGPGESDVVIVDSRGSTVRFRGGTSRYRCHHSCLHGAAGLRRTHRHTGLASRRRRLNPHRRRRRRQWWPACPAVRQQVPGSIPVTH